MDVYILANMNYFKQTLLLVAMLLAGCGQRGALFLPEHPPLKGYYHQYTFDGVKRSSKYTAGHHKSKAAQKKQKPIF
jgi:hypothetical protein